MTTTVRTRAPWHRIPALEPPVAPGQHHEHLEDHHLALAHQLHEALAKPVDPTPVAARIQMTRVIDSAELELCGALRQAQILTEVLSAHKHHALLRAATLLQRAHDDAWRNLQKARLQLANAEMVEARILLARVFADVGRAEHAHHYLRTARGFAA
jgi:hypothetical protein